MKVVLKLVAGLVILIVLAIAGLIAWPFVPVVQDRFGGAEHRAWLEDHRTEIDLAAADPGFDFGPDIHDARFVMLSEIHGYRAVQALDLALIEHFAQTGPARTYLAELGPGQALAFNTMISGGDDAPARAVFDAWADSQAQWANQEFFQKLERIRDLNAALPADRRIWFVGVDAPADRERLPPLVVEGPDAEPGFDSFAAVQALNAQLGRAALERESDNRYTHILANIDIINGVDPDRAFYGLWGLFHGTKTTVNGAKPLALRLNRAGGAFEDEVATLTTLCVDGCLNMMPARAMPSFLHGDGDPDYLYIPSNFDDVMLAWVRGINEVKASMGAADIAAFPMGGAGSPYASGDRLRALSGYLMVLQGFEYGGPAAEITDYYIVMRNSAGLTPWSGTVHDVTGAAPQTGIAAAAARLQ